MREQVKTSDEDVKQVINAAFKRWLEENGNIHQLQHLKELEMQVDATENKENLSGSVSWPSTCSLKTLFMRQNTTENAKIPANRLLRVYLKVH